MTTLTVRQSVADYDTWEAAFDGHEEVRRSHGATGHRVLRDGTDVLVLVDFPDAASAQSFRADLPAVPAGGYELSAAIDFAPSVPSGNLDLVTSDQASITLH